MYDLRQLRRVVDNPKLFVRECNRLYHTRLNRRRYNPDGLDILTADWDNLVILDACRYDAFAARSDLPGRLERRRSRGSMTAEFLRGNFDGRDCTDTVYVTATPMFHWNRNRGAVETTFHHEVNVWREAGWDEEFHTVLPETMVEHAEQAAARFPRKRLVVHFVQPHFPAIGPTGSDHPELNSMRIWDAIDNGDLAPSRDVLRRAYVENLDTVLPHVGTLLDSLAGRTVVTADHGQMLGERSFPIPYREYGHPVGTYTDELLDVPWLVHEEGPRREIVAEEPTTDFEASDELGPAGMADADEATVAERLEDLGYVM